MATPIIKQDVLDYAPELFRVSDPAWVTILNYVNAMSPDGFCGIEADIKFARVLLAAHYGAISRRGKSGAAGPVTSEAAGAVRRSYGLVALAGSDAALGSTPYGQQYMQIVSVSCSHGPILV